MRTRLMTALAVLMLCAPGITAAQTATTRTPSQSARPDDEGSSPQPTAARGLTGTWRSATSTISLSGDFEVSVWGPKASSVRDVEMTVRPSHEATLRVTSKIVDARGRTVAGSTSIEEAQIVIGEATDAGSGRTEHAVKVVNAERRYPDDPNYKWPLDGLRVRVTSLGSDVRSIEIRFDTPEGRGSFWETLTRRAAPQRRAPR